MERRFCVFVMSHGRPENIVTLNTLKRCGYTGDLFIVVDDEDASVDKYKEKYNEKVLVFSKDEIATTFDLGDKREEKRCIVFARNACFMFAEKLGYTHFLELDDDYESFEARRVEDGKLKKYEFKNLDDVFRIFVDFLEESKALSVCMAQGGDLIGGKGNKRIGEVLLRKAMNTFFCCTKRRFNFVGRINEDVNTYTSLGMTGGLFLTYVFSMIKQKQTQKNKGGMTDVYIDSGTYVKSFYSVIFAPSCVKIAAMGDKRIRIHHNVDWRHCVPKIMNERWRRNG